MARLARVVIPGLPHHVTQRGNRREPVFFEDGDYSYYLKLVRDAAAASGTAVWAYCLMPNHVHFIMVPSEPDGLRKTFADAHRRYTSIINKRHGWVGHLWQGRFYSVAMDERHLSAAIQYVTTNPVEAGLVKHAGEWRWSSAAAHLEGRDDGLVAVGPVLERTGPFRAWLDRSVDTDALERLLRSHSTGRPAGDQNWLAALAQQTGRSLARKPPGPAKRSSGDSLPIPPASSPMRPPGGDK